MPRYNGRSEGFRVREARRVAQADKKIQALNKVPAGNMEVGDFKKFLSVTPFCPSQRNVVRELHAKYVQRQAEPAAPQNANV
jgi:hypothetical protein